MELKKLRYIYIINSKIIYIVFIFEFKIGKLKIKQI